MTDIVIITARKELAVLNKGIEEKWNEYRLLCNSVDAEQKKLDKLSEGVEGLVNLEEDLKVREKQVLLDLEFIKNNKKF